MAICKQYPLDVPLDNHKTSSRSALFGWISKVPHKSSYTRFVQKNVGSDMRETWGTRVDQCERTGRVFGALGVPGSQLLEDEAGKCLGWGIGSELVWGARFLKRFWHLRNLGDKSRSM